MTACIVLTSCATQTWHQPEIPPLGNLPAHTVPDIDILAVSAEMTDFLDQHVPPGMRESDKAFALAYATLNSNFLAFKYDPAITLSAQDAFDQKTGNCLTFSNLFVALAREAGLRAWYQEVEVPQKWSSINETLLVNLHVNAIVQDRRTEYVIDVSSNKPGTDSHSRRISDQQAHAQFYNNLGVEALIDNDLSTARGYFVKAIETQADLSYIWSNLGVVFRRNEQNEDAKKAYQFALTLNSGESAALSNLYTVHMEEGNEIAAQSVHSRVERHRRKNPYYLHYLSSQAVEEQRYGDAINLARRAIKIDKDEYRFHVTLARSQLLIGDKEAARLSLARAKELAPADSGLSTMGLPELANFTDS